MSFITPLDGQPAVAEHVAQLTETLSGLRAELVTLTATLTARAITPSTTNAYDLGTTAVRWRTLWAVDGEFTNVPTVGGVSLDSRYALASALTALTTRVTALETSVNALKVHVHELDTFGSGVKQPTGGIP